MENTEFEPWSREWAIQQHRAMYHWIADEIKSNGVKYMDLEPYKRMYIKSIGLKPADITLLCFCCHYTTTCGRGRHLRCKKCPLDWESVSGFPKCDNRGLYTQLYDAIGGAFLNPCTKNIQRCVSLANKIAEVPEK